MDTSSVTAVVPKEIKEKFDEFINDEGLTQNEAIEALLRIVASGQVKLKRNAKSVTAHSVNGVDMRMPRRAMKRGRRPKE